MDIKPDDFKKEMTEHEKQGVLTNQLEHMYENFISEYDMSEISVIGTFTMFTNALMSHYEFRDDEEDDDQ